MNIPERLDEETLKDAIGATVGLTPGVLLALDQAKRSHSNQLRESGEFYLFEHIYPLTKMVIDFFGDAVTQEVVMAALLHDALEDDRNLTDVRFQHLFGEAVYRLVKPLSKPYIPELQSLSETERRMVLNSEYFKRIGQSSYETRIIKLLDRLDNLHWALTFGPELIRIYVHETKEFYLPLAKETSAEIFTAIGRELMKLEEKAHL